jgi:catechol 2,3-dioxygenase-like lactoylglutathione lyase family enzyme
MIQHVYHVGINVKDLDRTIEFYSSLGFEVEYRGTAEDPVEIAEMFGLPDLKKLAYAFMVLNNDVESIRLDLCQFIDPPPVERPPSLINEIGLVRICFHAHDLEAMHKALVARGASFYRHSEISTVSTGEGVLKFFMFVDPDGVILEVSDNGQG